MATPVLTNIWKVGFQFQAGAQRAAIVLGISSSAASPAALHSILNGAVTSAMWGHMPPTVRITTARYFKLDGVTPTTDIATVGTNWDGSAAAGDLLIAPAVLISLRTAERGPHARGRLYLPFAAESICATGQLVTGTVTSLQTAWDTFRNALVTANAPLQVVSYGNLDNVPPPDVAHAPASRAVTSLTVRTIMATQRRRQDRQRG